MSLMQMITRLSAMIPFFSSWETCAFDLIEKNRPSSVSFICKSSQHCPSNPFHNKLQIPSQTIFGLRPQDFPVFAFTEMVFLVGDTLIDWNNDTVEKYRRGGKNDFQVVVVANNSDDFDDDVRSMEKIFAGMWRSGIVKCAVVLVNGTSLQVFTYFPFKSGESCGNTTPVLVDQCSDVSEMLFDVKQKIYNLHKCPIRITLVDDRPFLHTQFNQIRGRLGHMIREIAIRMNATIEPMAPSSGGGGGTCGPEEFTGTRGQVWDGTAHMAVGSFNRKECSTLSYISIAYTQCMSWCTPVLSASDYVYLFLVKQFEPQVWAALILSVIVVVCSVVILGSATHEPWSGNNAFNLALVVFAQPPPVAARSTPVRVVVAIWLWACLVVRTAYEGELKSQSAVQLGSHIIRGLEEMVSNDMLLCSALGNLQMLKGIETPTIKQIYEKSKICNGSLYENMALAAVRKDRAVFTSDLRCSVTGSEISQDDMPLFSTTGGCFKTYQVSPIITTPGSPFKRRWAVIQDRCIQAGLVIKWLDIKPPERQTGGARPFSLGHLLPALFVLGVGCLVGMVIFVTEKSCHKWSQLSPEFKARPYKLFYVRCINY